MCSHFIFSGSARTSPRGLKPRALGDRYGSQGGERLRSIAAAFVVAAWALGATGALAQNHSDERADIHSSERIGVNGEQPRGSRFSVGGALFAALPLARPERDLFRPGPGGELSVRYAWTHWIMPEIVLGTLLLSDGSPPADINREPPGVGTWTALNIGMRVLPFSDRRTPARMRGLWLSGGGGAGLTGRSVRPSATAAVGYAFSLNAFALSPVVRYAHIFQQDNPVSSSDARLLLAGVELAWTAQKPPVKPVVSSPPPPSDRDGDGIVDEDDACPDDAEDYDGFEDADGCPDPDNDGDGIPDTEDACPNAPEDFDGFEDEDGCPDPDNDGDGILDVDDQCPDEPEVYNGIEDEDGCPDAGVIELKDERIILEERVLFDFERARVKHSARPIIEAIVKLYRRQRNWEKLRVEGHADVRGSESFNVTLSERRAEQVRLALVEAGIPAEIIDFVGYGRGRPRVLGDTEDAHQRNRRVEFVILSRTPIDAPDFSQDTRAPDTDTDTDTPAAGARDEPAAPRPSVKTPPTPASEPRPQPDRIEHTPDTDARIPSPTAPQERDGETAATPNVETLDTKGNVP